MEHPDTRADCYRLVSTKALLGHADIWTHDEFLAARRGFNLTRMLQPRTYEGHDADCFPEGDYQGPIHDAAIERGAHVLLVSSFSEVSSLSLTTTVLTPLLALHS